MQREEAKFASATRILYAVDFSFLLEHLSGESTWLLVIAIALSSALLEDVVMVVAGILAADGVIPVSAALVGGYLGALIADCALYALGTLARTHARLARYVEHDITASFRTWFLKRYRYLVLIAHFVPGLRTTTYIASGLFHLPFRSFLPRALISGVAMCTFLFTLSYWLGSSTWLGPVRYAVALLVFVALFGIGRAQYRALKREQELSARSPEAPQQ